MAYTPNFLRKQMRAAAMPRVLGRCHNCDLPTYYWLCYICNQVDCNRPIYNDIDCLMVFVRAGDMG